MRRSLSALVLATTIALACASAASAATGELDPSFADGGKLVVDFGGKTGSISDLAIQPDGKIVLAGWQFTTAPPYSTETLDADFVVKRLNADGTPDGDFGNGGTQVIPVPLNTQPAYNIANAVALQPDGKILVGGYSRRIGMTNQYTTVVRLQANGQLDTSFQRAGVDGGPGMVVSGMGSANDLEVDSQGRIVLGGTLAAGLAPDSQAIVRRWLASGGGDAGFEDPAFGWAAGRQDGGAGIALQPDGRIVLAGYSDTATEFDAGVARLTTSGALDSDFSGDGLFSFGLGAGASDGSSAVVVQPDGKIDVAGYGTTSDDFTLTRLTSAGAPDNSLAGTSTVTADFGGEDAATAIALQANGKILLAGTGPTDLGFVRFQPGGAPDTTFGPDGKRRVDFGAGTYSTLSDVALQSDGKVVAVGGLNDNSGVFKGTVVRLQGDSKDEGGAPVGPGGGGKAKVYRCGGKRATIVGTNKKNRLRGTRRADVIVGLGGNDTISGVNGNDIVCGGSGNDKISGGSGKDKLYGDSGKDRLSGDSGNDRESGGSGNDKLLGGSGKDILAGGSGKDGLSGGSGNDKLNGNSGKDKLNGGSGKDGCAGKDRKASC